MLVAAPVDQQLRRRAAGSRRRAPDSRRRGTSRSWRTPATAARRRRLARARSAIAHRLRPSTWRRSTGSTPANAAVDLVGRLADRDDGLDALRLGRQRRQVEALVAAAGEQHDASRTTRIAVSAACGVVAFESLNQRTPSRSPSGSMRCGGNANAREPRVDVRRRRRARSRCTPPPRPARWSGRAGTAGRGSPRDANATARADEVAAVARRRRCGSRRRRDANVTWRAGAVASRRITTGSSAQPMATSVGRWCARCSPSPPRTTAIERVPVLVVGCEVQPDRRLGAERRAATRAGSCCTRRRRRRRRRRARRRAAPRCCRPRPRDGRPALEHVRRPAAWSWSCRRCR